MIDWLDVSTWQVLVVDDEPDNLEVVAETLEYSGAEVKTAQNGKEALQVLASFTPDFVLTDLSMPVMDGWQLRAEIKGNPQWAAIPVLALSAHAILGDKERALETGFNGYITKPVNIHTLPTDIRSALGIGETAAPAEKPADVPPEKATDKAVSSDSTAASAEKPADAPSEKAADKTVSPVLTAVTAEKPAEVPPDKTASSDSTAAVGLAEKE
ncbi:MAG: response regulator [Anaerolineae bacterium]